MADAKFMAVQNTGKRQQEGGRRLMGSLQKGEGEAHHVRPADLPSELLSQDTDMCGAIQLLDRLLDIPWCVIMSSWE